MNKTELVKKIADATGLSAADAKKALDATTCAIKEALVDGDKVQLIGFGTFSTKERPARQGVNPSSGEKIQIAAKTVVKFNPGSEFEEAVNK
ncbi:DNA-binding protein HU [Hallella bergensis DSM 17361]|uniref:DNA-binding protein HU n=1 Tax=Hallella bergensis DSM 17361 TaxID=585502 RepID=D1PTR1_9BACT|nr:HU family DNA-binding protein [Hallella bergensis]EFA45247.1 DNA-binding protein HU [Hallella bergensis DSM 17361]